jgi:hypothetical protein
MCPAFHFLVSYFPGDSKDISLINQFFHGEAHRDEVGKKVSTGPVKPW